MQKVSTKVKKQTKYPKTTTTKYTKPIVLNIFNVDIDRFGQGQNQSSNFDMLNNR